MQDNIHQCQDLSAPSAVQNLEPSPSSLAREFYSEHNLADPLKKLLPLQVSFLISVMLLH